MANTRILRTKSLTGEKAPTPTRDRGQMQAAVPVHG